jgi:dTDP-4-dehydrorhamnose reductase
MKVVVVGAAGQLGAAIVHEWSAHADVIGLTRGDLDITDRGAVQECLASARPDVIVNCVAYNQVDAAEDDPTAALRVNMLGVQALAGAAADAGAVFVHYSTDFVFDGLTDRPYMETDPPNPRSVYGVSKRLGEWMAADAPRHYVLRVESLFGRAPNGINRGSAASICSRIAADEPVSVFVDRTVSPTHVVDAAAATRAIVERALPHGVYHCVNSGCCTWKEFAEAAGRFLGRQPRLQPITLDSVTLRALRPKFCALSNAKLASLGVTLPDWQDALRRSLGSDEVHRFR